MSKEVEDLFKKRFELSLKKGQSILYGGKYWRDFSSEEKTCVLKHVDDDNEIFFGYFGNCELWTVLSFRHIFSLKHGEFVVGDFSKINGKLSFMYKDSLDTANPTYKEVSSTKELIKADLLRLDNENKSIWVPEGGPTMCALSDIICCQLPVRENRVIDNLIDDMLRSYLSSEENRKNIRNQFGDDVLIEVHELDIFYAGLASRLKNYKKIIEFEKDIREKTIFSIDNIQRIMTYYFDEYQNYINYLLKLEALRSRVILNLDHEVSLAVRKAANLKKRESKKS